jgi:hypothetical protein
MTTIPDFTKVPLNAANGRPASKQQFVLAEFGAGPGRDGLHIELPGGASVRLAEAGEVKLLAALIRALA